MVWERNAVPALPWSVVGRRDMVLEQKETRLPLLGTHLLPRRAGGGSRLGPWLNRSEHPAVYRKVAGSSPAGLVHPHHLPADGQDIVDIAGSYDGVRVSYRA